MAPRNGVESQNESRKETREREQAEAVDAWIKADHEEKAATAAIAALDALDAQAPLNPDQIAAREIEVKRQTKAREDKKDIEESYVNELRCPIAKLYADIDKKVAEQEAHDLIDDINAPERQSSEAAREQIQEMRAENSLVHARLLLENKLLPSDLKSGSPSQKRAAMLVRPDLAAQLPAPSAVAALDGYADELQPIFDRLALGYEAAKDMEKGVVVGKAGETLKEAISNPSRLGHGAVGILGLALLWNVFSDKTPNEGVMKWVKGILGAGMVVAGGFGAVKGLDVLNTATNIHTDELFATEAMKAQRAKLEAQMGPAYKSSVDDMMRIYDAPIDSFADAYLSALRSHSSKVEKTRLESHGLSEKESGYASGEYIKKGGDWFFTQCYEMGLADGKITEQTDERAKREMGASYAKTYLKGHSVGTILVAREMVASGVTVTPEGAEYSIVDPKLRELADNNAEFAAALNYTGTPGVYTIYGLPVKYDVNTDGTHRFKKTISGTGADYIVSGALRDDGLQSTLARIAEEAKQSAATLYEGAAGSGASGRMRYNSMGAWVLDPPEARVAHAGLPTYLRKPSDPKVPAILYYDSVDNKVKIGIDKNGDGKPEIRPMPYITLADVAEEFEKTILKTRAKQDISKTMLIDFEVESYSDTSTTETTVVITYKGARGTVVYEADKIKSFNLGADAELEDKWTEGAALKQAKFLGDHRVQAALLRATTNYTGYDESLIGGIVSKFLGKGSEIVNWVKNDSIANKFASEWEEQVIRKMTDIMYNPVTGFNKTYVDNVYKMFYSNDKFKAQENVFMNAQIASLEGSGVLMAKVVPLQGPDMDIEWVDLTGLLNERARGPIAGALSPLKNEKPTPSSSMSWTVVNGVINFATQDKVREKQFSDRVDAYLIKLNTDLHALRTPPAKVTQNDLKTAIEKAVYDAQKEAIAYWGKNDTEAIKMMMFAPIEKEPHFADWKQSTELVADYMAGNMKWENYGFLPNAENMAEIMKLWYEAIGYARTAPVSPQEALDYAKFFIWSVWSRMGSVSDYSPDKLFGGTTVSTVSDTLFDENIGMLRATLDKYPAWSGSSSTFKAPAVEGLASNFDVYKEKRITEMNQWFEKNNDIKVWERIHRWGPDMFKWRTTYEQSYTNRMKDLEARANLAKSETQFYKDTEDFKSFLLVEQKIYQAFIDAGAVPETDYLGVSLPFAVFVSTEVTKDWAKYFGLLPGTTRDLPGYIATITKNLGDALDVGNIPWLPNFVMPNFPGIPFWA